MSGECADSEQDGCMCRGGSLNLDILKQDVQRAYEERLDAVERYGGPRKLQMQVDVMKSWVDDLVGQNSLLVQAIEELETEATAKLLHERTKHSEIEGELSAEIAALRRRLARKDSDLRGLIEVLRRLREFDYCSLEGIHFFEVTESDIFGTVEWRTSKLEQGDSKVDGSTVKPGCGKSKNRRRYKLDKKSKRFKELKNMNDSLLKENLAKEREIRRLNKDMHQYEQKLLDLRNEISSTKCASACAKRDVEVSAGICCSDRVENRGEAKPGAGAAPRDEAGKCQEKVRSMEVKLKSADDSVFALRKVNVALSEELHALRRVCAALDEQCRACAMRAQFKDEIIREMRRQLKQAKARVTCQTLVSSTPAPSTCSAHSDPDLSLIERDPSVQNTSADSVENLERMLYRDCCLTPSSMMACSRQARLVSASAGSHSMVPTVGLALSHTTNDGHSPESARHSRNQSSCDCANIAHAIGGNPSDKRSQAERLSDSHSKDDKNSKKSSFAGLFKRNKSTKTSESSDGQGSPDRESKKTRNKKEKKSKAHKSSDSKDSESSQDSGSSSKKSKKSIWKRKNKEKDKKLESKGSDASLGSAESSPVEAGTGTAVLTPADVGAGTSTLDSLDGLLCGKFLPISSCPHSSCSSPRPDPLCRSYPCSPRVPKPCPARTLPPCIVKPCAKRSKGACGSKSAIPTPCPRRTSPCGIKPCPAKTLFKPCELSLSGSLGGSPRSCSSRNSSLIPCPGSTSSPCAPKPYTRARSSSPCGSPSPCGSKPCPTRSLLKPCSRSQNSSPCRSPSPCGSKLSSEIPCPGSTSSPCDPKPCPVKSLLTPCTRARSSSPCGSPSPCGTKPCPTRSLLKPCSRSQNSSPCRSPSPCGSKLSSEIPCPGSTSTPCDPKPCPAKSLFKPCTRSATPPCGLSGFKLSSLLPCPFNMESSCAQRPPCDYKSPCDQKPSCVPKPPCGSKPCTPKPCAPKPCAPKPCAPNPCISKPCAPKPCAPKPCPAKSRPCSRSQSPCDSPQNSDDNLLNATLSKLSNFLSGPCRTSTPCAPKPYGCISSIKSCSRSQETSPCHSPTLSEDSCLNKTFPCTPKPCPAASAPCTRKPPCIRKTPCAPKPCRPKPCNEISPNHSLLGSANSSCVDICSLTKDPCEPQAPCESTFNPFDFLKRCVQFLPGSEDLKPLCAQEACPRGEAVCPTIKEEINASTSCSRGADKCILTQEESCELAGMCDSARAQYYRNKLISTQQILDNKEETIRIQGESLAVAESRLTTLTIRAGQLRQELECKSRELRMLRRAMSGCCCKETQRVDACTGAEIPPCAELQKHKNVVKTLQTNLSIIEELYRECFYETAKQEALIDKLRQSYLDVRLSEREKSDEIGRLQNVVNTQKWSLDQCQDVAMEVEGLKVEISNFLSSSNNDSGMWERSEESAATDVGEELQQITDQLLQLQHLLHQEDPLIAELTGENCRLKCENNELEGQIGDYRQKVCSLECTIRNNEEVIDNLEREKECTESQLRCAQSQAGELSERVDELECANRCAQDKISDLQCLQNATNQKLEAALEQLCHHECTEAQLRAQLEEAKELAEENQRICGELCALQQSVRAWGAQLQQSQARVCALHAELQRARARADTADLNYREQLEMTAELQEQLEEAHARGAALSEESRRVLCAVRQWVRDNCAQRREQEEKIKRQQSIIWTLNKELEERQCCCAPAPAACGACRAVGCTKCGRARERCGLGTCPAVRVQSDTGVCDAPSCSSGPAPPRRVLKKKTKGCSERCVSRCRSASAQQPEGTRDAATCAEPAPPRRCAAHAVRHLRLAGCIGPSVSPTRPRGQSPSQELLQRVENLHEALAAGQRRWGCAPADRRS